tara:strand:- start:212 stop:364 length:153 start_codon:yes stop_codon:yes gene_type:complete
MMRTIFGRSAATLRAHNPEARRRRIDFMIGIRREMSKRAPVCMGTLERDI